VAVAAVAALVVTLVPQGATAGPTDAAAAQSGSASIAAVSCTAPSVPAADATSDFFLKLDGIAGESTDARHPHEIVIDSFLWGVNLGHTACGSAPTRPTVNEFTVNKRLDAATPKLFEAAVTRRTIPNAVFTARKSAGKGQVEYLVIDLKDVVISSVVSDGTDGTFPQESISLTFSEVKFTYTQQRQDGTAGTPVTFCTDVKANKSC
jgi:type VI secretion system secreted protein Hcp